MAAKCSTSSSVLWNWVIEALANYEQVDTSTLIGLLKMAPAIQDVIGKDAREMISLRILEGLFVREKEARVDTDSALNAKISFDPSERSEDVLQRILRETPELTTELEKEKWDVCPFLIHKRSSLPKCPLKKLKETILDSSHPLLVSLKEKSKLVTANASENINPTVDDVFDAQTTVAKDDLAYLNPGKDKNKFQEHLSQESNQVGNSTGGTVEHTGREECEMFIDPPIECSNGNKPIDLDEHAAPEKLHCHDDNTSQDTSREKHDKWVSVNGTKSVDFVGKSKDLKNSIQQNALKGGPSSEAKDSMELDSQLETTSDSDSEGSDIASKKEAFLNSQSMLGQDSMAMNDWTEINLCMKCNEGGQLLTCSSDSCPLRVHESCLGFSATLDENAVFFCPFCAYSRAISTYLEAKRKAFLARKDLQAFSSFRVKRKPKKSSKKQRGLETNEARQTGALAETIIIDDPSSGEKIAAVTSEKDSLIPESSRLRINNDISCEDEGVFIKNPSMTVPEEISQKVGEGCELPMMEEHGPTMPKKKCKEKESHKSIESSYSIRPRKRKLQYTPPAVPSLRRKKLPWTKAEEEILKEGMQKYSSVKKKGIPWTEILDFGRNVFHKGRTTIDLKDKWRNICKGSPNLK